MSRTHNERRVRLCGKCGSPRCDWCLSGRMHQDRRERERADVRVGLDEHEVSRRDDLPCSLFAPWEDEYVTPWEARGFGSYEDAFEYDVFGEVM